MEQIEQTTTGLVEDTDQDIQMKINGITLQELSEKDMLTVAKNLLLNNLTEELRMEIKKRKTDVSDLLETWLSTLNSSITRMNYRYNIDEFMEWLKGKNPIELRAIDAQNYLIYLKSRKYSDGSIRFKFACVSSFFSFLVRNDVIMQNYFTRVKLPKKQIGVKTNNDIPTDDEVRIFKEELLKNIRSEGRGCAGRIKASKMLLVAIEIMEKSANRVGCLPSMNIDPQGYYTARSKGSVVRGKLDDETKSLIKEMGFDSTIPFRNIKAATIKKYFGIVANKLFREGKLRKAFSPHSLKHYAAVTFWRSCKDINQLREFLHHRSVMTSQIYLSSLNIEI